MPFLFMKAILALASALLLLALAILFDLLASGLISDREVTFLVYITGLTACGLLTIAWLNYARRPRRGPLQVARTVASTTGSRPPGAGTVIGNSLSRSS